MEMLNLKPLSREKLEKILAIREQIIKNTGGTVFEDSTQLIHQMREERTRELMGEAGEDA